MVIDRHAHYATIAGLLEVLNPPRQLQPRGSLDPRFTNVVMSNGSFRLQYRKSERLNLGGDTDWQLSHVRNCSFRVGY